MVAGGFEALPDGWRNPQWPLSSANQVHRLTELRYIDGLRRLETDGGRQPLDLPEHRPTPPVEQFGIGMYNHGEGLYFDIKPEWLQNQVDKRSKLSPAHRNMDLAFERLMPSMIQQLPSLQERENRSGFTVLHTFSHCLIKALAQTSGFSLGSIRERLYYHCENGVIVDAGILQHLHLGRYTRWACAARSNG